MTRDLCWNTSNNGNQGHCKDTLLQQLEQVTAVSPQWTPSRTKLRIQWQYWILAAVFRCCSWGTAWNRYGRNFSCFVPQWALVTNIPCVPKYCYQSVYCCLIRYFLVRIRIAKCFTYSSKWFQREVMSENEHTFWSCIHHVRTCTASAQLAWAAA
jgi:hypothetical protein